MRTYVRVPTIYVTAFSICSVVPVVDSAGIVLLSFTRQGHCPSVKHSHNRFISSSMSYSTPPSIEGQNSARFVWDVLSTLPASLQYTGAQVVRFASDYVKHDVSKGVNSFDWSEFKNAVDDLPGVDLVMEGFSSDPIAPSPVVQLPTVFADALVNKLKMPINEEDVAQTIQTVLERLDYAKQDGVADFRVIPADSTKKPPTKAGSAWEYRLLMMAPNVNVQADFFVQVAVLEVKAQKEHESDWVPLKDDLQATSAHVTLMKLAATKGFRRPVPIIPSTKA
ncbi:putative delta-endotoxin CytB [Rhizoctonia solani 123E]|uniref:Putative delta-endotoxin CytB n=1 Tax=Rhizoctonia solani 123E TaxID=1423351 RepID=A0A074S117_9AGAM|nr:putative delta-endotoxin CytB [Rhizoctonia solani 123E]